MGGVFVCEIFVTISFKYSIQKYSNQIRLKSNLTNNDANWLVWWYCGIYKNHKAESQPNVLVAFKELDLLTKKLSDNVILKNIPLTSLGQLRIGSIWKDSMCRSEAIYDQSEFDIDFSTDMWRFTSFHDAAKQNQPPPYPRGIYPLQYKNDKNWLLEFNLPTGGKLIVNCLEFFSRCYGRSQELTRILATYSCLGENAIHKSRLFAPMDDPEEKGVWKVKLQKYLATGDTVFLAHAKYDAYTENTAKRINSQIESNYDPENNSPLFIQVAPWFLGSAKLKAKGIWFDNGKSFLALQIVGCSDPTGVPIKRDVDSNKKDQLFDPGDISENMAGVSRHKLNELPEIIDLTGDRESDNGSSIIELNDPSFEILGEPRVIIGVKKYRQKGSAGHGGSITDNSEFASGDSHGSGKGVGAASISASQIIESKGALRDMWNAMLFLKKKYPSMIQSVEWFTFEDGFNADTEPKLIGLKPFDENEKITKSIKSWLYLNKNIDTPRGVLVARLIIDAKPIYIVEIQRKPKNNNPIFSEELLRGFVFTLNDQNQFEIWLSTLLSDIRRVEGAAKKLAGNCPGKASAFKHKTSKNEQMPCEAAVLNALKKMGVIFSIDDIAIG